MENDIVSYVFKYKNQTELTKKPPYSPPLTILMILLFMLDFTFKGL